MLQVVLSLFCLFVSLGGSSAFSIRAAADPLGDMHTGEHSGSVIQIKPEVPDRHAKPIAVFAGMSKITGKVSSFSVDVGSVFRFKELEIIPLICYSDSSHLVKEDSVFVEVKCHSKGGISDAFSGWMFANSPGLNSMEHPVYDVWLIECKGFYTN